MQPDQTLCTCHCRDCKMLGMIVKGHHNDYEEEEENKDLGLHACFVTGKRPCITISSFVTMFCFMTVLSLVWNYIRINEDKPLEKLPILDHWGKEPPTKKELQPLKAMIQKFVRKTMPNEVSNKEHDDGNSDNKIVKEKRRRQRKRRKRKRKRKFSKEEKERRHHVMIEDIS